MHTEKPDPIIRRAGSRTGQWRRFLVIAVGLLFLAGCGYSPEKPAYDTSSNSKGFPQMACDVLDGVESRRLADFASITTAFGDLYTEYPDLLDNEDWHTVVSRLGRRFCYLGDRAAAKGIEHYIRAAAYYSLASFARPGDQKMLDRSGLFSVWRKAVIDSVADTASLPALLSDPSTVGERINLMKHFVFGDSLQRQFAHQHLVNELFADLRTDSPQSDSALAGLSRPDRAFLASLGGSNIAGMEPVVQFEKPRVDVMAYRVMPLAGYGYHVELYLAPRENITADYSIAFWIDISDTTQFAEITGSGYFSADFKPRVPSSTWAANTVVAVGWDFPFDGLITDVNIGLYTDQGVETSFARLAGRQDSLITLPAGD